ncbi:MAG: energy transducer TonB [Bacteroidales bacterium]|nr:energy transducer TonB [Bacteroidales bacterium]
MDVKKAPRCDLENKRSVFLQIGLIIPLALSLIAFEWSSAVEVNYLDFYGTEVDVPVEVIPVTTRKEMEKPSLPKSVEFLLIEDNEAELEVTLDLGTSEIEAGTTWDWGALEAPAEEREDIHVLADEMPEFPGGERALFQYLSSSIRYPREALRNEVEGRVYVEFVVDRYGKITRVNVKRGVHPALDQEALRVIESMPDWKPGVKAGKFVNVLYTVPINFQIALN